MGPGLSERWLRGGGLEGTIWLLSGRYDLLIYTSDFYDVDGIYYRGLDKSNTAEAKIYDIAEPDPLFVHFYEDFEVKEGDNRLESGLQPQTYKYWYEVDVEGLDYISSAWLEIDGMYTSVYMADESHRADVYGAQRVESTIHKDENKIRGEFFSFGPHQASDVKNTIVLTFINGRTIRVELNDILADIKKLRKGGEIEIDQKIVINVGDTGSGFVPDVKDWDDYQIDMPI